VNVGPIWIVAQLASADAVLALRPDLLWSAAFERRLEATGISVFGAHATGAAAIEVRSFAPSCGVGEDPVCGSGNGAIAAFRRARGALPAASTAYVAAQGQCVGRDGRIAITVAAYGPITVGGSCVTVIDAGDDDDLAWHGQNAQPFDGARAECRASTDRGQRSDAFRDCMAGKGWTRS
jgi:PhzF family phenazine biosynthesis protein